MNLEAATKVTDDRKRSQNRSTLPIFFSELKEDRKLVEKRIMYL